MVRNEESGLSGDQSKCRCNGHYKSNQVATVVLVRCKQTNLGPKQHQSSCCLLSYNTQAIHLNTRTSRAIEFATSYLLRYLHTFTVYPECLPSISQSRSWAVYLESPVPMLQQMAKLHRNSRVRYASIELFKIRQVSAA